MTMDVEPNAAAEKNPELARDIERDDIISFLTYNKDICFKNQQRWDPDLTHKEKFDIALKLFLDNKLNFLIKFGKYLTYDQLDYFKRTTTEQEPDFEEIKLVLSDLYSGCSENINIKTIKNRRYEALKHLVQEDTYFSEIEMMKRNPLLYEQLVGQYLTEDEKRERDKYKLDEQATFVKILMESIEREDAQIYKKEQEEVEDDQMEESDTDADEDMEKSSSPIPSTSRWGEFEESKMHRPKPKKPPTFITQQERSLLKDEFITTMYQNFLDGKDEDFNYGSIDNDTSYDNIDEMDNDAEERYFASEEPEDVKVDVDSSEDELDMYMSALSQHPAVSKLSEDMKKL